MSFYRGLATRPPNRCSYSESHKKRKRDSDENILCADDEGGRSYLVCSEGNQMATKQVLKHETIGLLFVKLTNDEELPFLGAGALKHIYHLLRQKQQLAFEIVFVPVFPKQPHNQFIPSLVRKRNNMYLFTIHLSQMPWPSLPFTDSSKWRKLVVDRYKSMWRDRDSELALFDSYGRSLTWNGINLLVKTFGADYYPFTCVRETEFLHEYYSPLKTSSIQGLLGGDHETSLISARRQASSNPMVPLSTLQGKVVGLLFYFEDDIIHNYHLMKKLKGYHLRANGDFEFVFISLDYERGLSSKTSFNSFLNMNPWLLALPFRDQRIRPLAQALAVAPSQLSNNHLVIVGGQDGDFFIDPYGYSIMEEYGFDAYPFTRSKALEIEQKIITELKLHTIFESTGTDFIVCMGKGKVKKKPISCLQSRKVIVLYLKDISEDMRKSLCEFRVTEKGTEIILFVTDMRGTSFDTLFPTMPKKWLSFPPTPRRSFKCLMIN